MKQLTGISLIVLLFVLFVGCSNDGNNMVGFSQPNPEMTQAASSSQQFNDGFRFMFGATLQPFKIIAENPNSANYGECFFYIEDDLNVLEYSCTVFDLSKVKHAYIYYGDMDGEFYATAKMYPLAGEISGNTVKGKLTNADLIGPLAEEGLAALLDAMDTGRTFVIFDTGDYAPGQIGGEISSIE